MSGLDATSASLELPQGCLLVTVDDEVSVSEPDPLI